MADYFTTEPLRADIESGARYSQATIAEVTDAIIDAAKAEECDDPATTPSGRTFLAALWNRGFKVVPNGDGRWVGDDNAKV